MTHESLLDTRLQSQCDCAAGTSSPVGFPRAPLLPTHKSLPICQGVPTNRYCIWASKQTSLPDGDMNPAILQAISAYPPGASQLASVIQTTENAHTTVHLQGERDPGHRILARENNHTDPSARGLLTRTPTICGTLANIRP